MTFFHSSICCRKLVEVSSNIPRCTFLPPLCDSKYSRSTFLPPLCDSKYSRSTFLPPLCDSKYTRTCAVLSMSSTQGGYVGYDQKDARLEVSPRYLEGLHRIDVSDGETEFRCGMYGLGSKFELAVDNGLLNESIGTDLVAMSVNELITTGAKPSHFVDYMSTKGHDVRHAEKIRRGMIAACNQLGCPLSYEKAIDQTIGQYVRSGSRYAQYEGLYGYYGGGYVIAGYDLGGVAIGSVKTDMIIDGKNIEVGDVLIGLPSSGVHSNGFSLVRRVLEQSGSSLRDDLPGSNITLGKSLMSPTAIYVEQVLDFISKGYVKGIVHIKDGGLTKNIPCIFPAGFGAAISLDSWVVPPIFKWIQDVGRIEDAEMRQTFNMGIGMVLVVSKESALKILGESHSKNAAYCIGQVVTGNGVRYE